MTNTENAVQALIKERFPERSVEDMEPEHVQVFKKCLALEEQILAALPAEGQQVFQEYRDLATRSEELAEGTAYWLGVKHGCELDATRPKGLLELAPGQHLWFVEGKCYFVRDA